ncbi:MAG: flagellar basal body rod protein FlgB [Verrucomicrobiota bacterium]
MIDALFNDPSYLAGKKTLDAIAVRQQAIASNIANLETPGYRRVDLASSFNAELERACASGDARQIEAIKPTIAADTSAVPNGRDGNTVNLEQEMMILNQNVLAHTVQSQLISDTLIKMRLAISGK